MLEITLLELKKLSVKVEELVSRYDIDRIVYEDLYREHERVHLFIENNLAHFQSKEEHGEAFCLSSYIGICLLARINEINESDNR